MCCDPHSQRFWHSQLSKNRCFSGTLLLFRWSNWCWQFDLLFLCLFKIQLECSWFTYYWKLAWRILSVTLLACAAAAAKSLQSCLTLCNPMDGSPPGSSIPGILQARTLEWVAISFSNVWKWKGKVKSLSCVWLFTTPWTAAYQALSPLGFSRQEYWSGLPLPSHILRELQIKTTIDINMPLPE